MIFAKRVLTQFAARARRGFSFAKRLASWVANSIRKIWEMLLALFRRDPSRAADYAGQLADVAADQTEQNAFTAIARAARWGVDTARQVFRKVSTPKRPISVPLVSKQPPAAIATELGLPFEVVRGRVARAVTRLRNIAGRATAVAIVANANPAIAYGPGLKSPRIAAAAIQQVATTVSQAVQVEFEKAQTDVRRAVRTAATQAINEAVLSIAAAAGNSVVGFEVCGILDDRIRPAHRARNGTKYYRFPRPGQKGYAQMPRPPFEADGTQAHNCRCFLVPIFAAINP